MRTILMGRRHGKENWELIAGPNITTSDQVNLRNVAMEKHPINETWAELELWGDSPVKGRAKFVTPDQAKDVEAEQERDEAALSVAREESEKRQQEQNNAAAKTAQAAHDKQVAELNKIHDSMRDTFESGTKALKAAQKTMGQPANA